MKQRRKLAAVLLAFFIFSAFQALTSFVQAETAQTTQPQEIVSPTPAPTPEQQPTAAPTQEQQPTPAQQPTPLPTLSPAPQPAVDPSADPGKDKAAEPSVDSDADNQPKTDNPDDESLWYSKKLPMKKEHQKLLWTYCRQRKLDYIDMLALISTESNFDEKCKSGSFYGYFQISKGNCKNLAECLETEYKPFDGSININWGTAMYSWILMDKRVKGLEGKKQRDVALSIYQRGTGGYDKKGLSKSFLKIFYKKKNIILAYFSGNAQ